MERISSVPLVVNDPYFSIWSPADRLTDVNTVSWTGKKMPIKATLVIDGQPLRVIGTDEHLPAMRQSDLVIEPTQTIAAFEAAGVALELRFAQRFDLSKLETIAEPITYFSAKATVLDGQAHDLKLSVSLDACITYEHLEPGRLAARHFDMSNSQSVCVGKSRQTPLNGSGDLTDIDWGYLYLACPADGRSQVNAVSDWQDHALRGDLDLSTTAEAVGHLLIAYDDVQSINYFGHIQSAYWKQEWPSMPALLDRRTVELPEILADCQRLDRDLDQQAETVGGDAYRLVCATAYRQAIADHKLIRDETGQPILLGKECTSNGCLGTVDVSFPVSPLFLAYNPALVQALLRPVFRFAALPAWPYQYAPHDVGRYPYATGQVYGLSHPRTPNDGIHLEGFDTVPMLYQYPANADLYREYYQMPLEESADMVLLACASDAKLHNGFVAQHRAQLLSWADYLIQNGQDPADQLCTDDFSGHLAHNVNLALKAVLAIGALGQSLTEAGLTAEAGKLIDAAKRMAAQWEQEAASTTDTRLAFDKPETWSTKYNLIWDDLLDLHLISPEVKQRELNRYQAELKPYGVPLDGRDTVVKADWLMWAASEAVGTADLTQFVTPLAKFLHETPDRVPFSDRFDAVSGRDIEWYNRSVIGGVFMPILRQQQLAEKAAK